MSNKEKELKLNTHGLTIDQIVFITESKSIEINWTTAENISTEDFKPSLYSELHALSYNTVINTPDEILPEEEYTLRINYTFLNDLNVLRTIKNGKCSEVFCIPAFPQLKGYNENIESIYIHKEDKTVFAPGLLTKKAKIGQNIFVTNVTQHITHSPFVVGNFKVTDISYNNIKCKIYTPPAYGIEAELKADINLVCQHVSDNFLMEELNIKIVFMYAECMTVSENAIYFPMSIFPMAGIDQNMHVREKICEFIAKLLTLNVNGHDFWLEVGIKEYIKTSLIRCIFGENEVQYRSKQDLDFVMKNDVYEPSLIKEKNKGKRSNLHKYYNYNFDVSDNFKMIKARLIFHVLENNLSRAFMEKIIYNILKMTSVNTCDFTRIVKDISGYDMASFFNYYVYRPGLMNVHLKFDKDKKGKVDVFMTQQSTSNRKNANKRVFGEFLFKVFEQEGVFEYKFTGEKLSFQCHFRTKKRKTEKEMIEQQRSYGKFVELPTENIEEDEHCNMQSQILFMRADPNFHMLARFYIEQPDFMYIEQLLLEKSVYAQIDAIKALSNKISGDDVQALERILNDTHIFYKIRIYIMHMFSQYAVERCDDKSGYEMSGDSSANYDFGYQKIIQYFIKKFCIPGSTIPKANDFVFMSTYFIQKNSSTALVSTNPESQKRFSDRVVKAKNIISAFLANILRFNSTEENVTVRTNFDKFIDQHYVSHGNYLASIIENMTYQLCSNSQIELDPLIAEFERLKLTDLVFPSYQNLISSSVLKTYLRLCFYGFIKLNSKAIIQYSAKNNFVSVREAAFDILCICYLNSSFEYLKEVITKDTKHIKLYILNTIKNILQLKDGKFYGNEEYNDAFNLLADINISYQQKFNYKSRYGVLFDNCSFFLQLLQEYYFDNCLMEILTDIVYLLHDRINVYADDEETAEIEQDSFIIKMRINSLIRLRCLDDVKYEFKHEIKKHDELMAKETFVKEKSEFIIQLIKLDSITVHYDDNIHKYYNSLADYKRKLLVAKNKDMKTLSISMGSKTESEMYTTETVSKSVTDDDNDLLQSKEIKVIDNHDDVEQEENLRYSIVKKLLRNGRIYIKNFNFSDFMIHVINKNVKKHKYYPKLNLKIAVDLEAQEYREFLHKQFSEFYITQKLGSHLYLNAKALENVIEGLYLEYNTFEPYILIDENLKQKCMIVLDAIYADSRSMYFAESIESTPTSLHNYNDIIRIPIHLNLIKQRLLDDKMVFLEVFVKYIELIFLNAMEYNDKESEIHNIAEAMLVKSRKLVLSEILPLLIENEEALHGVIPSFTDNIFNGSSFIFNNPAIYSLIAKHKNYECVYSVLKTITEDLMTLKESAQYIEPNTSYEYVRSVKKPMCITKIHEKILRESYVSIGHILNDMNLIIRNCIAFNGNSSWVVRVAKKMENHFKKEIALTFGTRYILSSKKSDANTNK